jgi:hypothetical protein
MNARIFSVAVLLTVLCGATAFAAVSQWSVDSLGIRCGFDDATNVLTVLEVAPGSLAETQGLQAGDVVVKINGVAPEAVAQFNEMFKPGATVTLTVTRGEWTKEIALTVPKPPEPPPQATTEEEKAKELLRKAGFTEEQINILTSMFVLKIKEEAAPEESPVKDKFVKDMVKAGYPEAQAEALSKIFKFSEEAAPEEAAPEQKPEEVKPENPPQPPAQPQTIEAAMKDAQARGVNAEAVQALIIKGRTENWDDAKIIAEISKMTTESKASDYQVEKKPVEIPAAIQDEINKVVEKTGTPEGLIKGTVEDMLRAGRTEADIMKYLEGLMPAEPAPANP